MIVLLTAPAAAVLVLLAALATIPPVVALAGTLAVAALMALIVRAHFRDVDAVALWVRRLTGETAAEAPATPLPEVVTSIHHLRRAWHQREIDLIIAAQWSEELFDSLPEPLILLDHHRRVARLNRAARQVFGQDLAGRDLAAILRDPVVLGAADAVLAGDVARDAEFTLPGTVRRTFRVAVGRLHGESRQGGTVVLAFTDLTTIRQMEQMRSDFVANASHELRTPLATLSGFIETLRGPARDDADARERFLGIMQDQASRMARLVNDLLSLSRIELNEHSPPRGNIDLGVIVERSVLAMHPLAQAKSVEIRATVADDARMVVGDQDELVQLVQNLLDNAVKYGREGTPVDVVLEASPSLPAAAGPALKHGAIRLSVRDRGEGIAREHLPRLTERFYRVDTARSRKLGGTGLGLAIVKHIVNRHRGVLMIDSVPGEGSVFSVYLPLGIDR